MYPGRRLLSLLAASLVLVGCQGGQLSVLLQFQLDGAARVAEVRHSRAVDTAWRTDGTPTRGEKEWLALCNDSSGALVRWQNLGDCTFHREESYSPEGGIAVTRREGVDIVIIPRRECETLVILSPSNVTTFPVASLDERVTSRSLRVLNTDIKHRTHQSVGPVGTVNNLVLLSGGYLASQEQTFYSDVDRVMRLFKFPVQSYRDSVPFHRYFDTVNVFSVFQPSVEAGASKPAKGTTTQNNLDCAYGATNEVALFCDTQFVLALAETSPAKPQTENTENTVIVTLVNDPDYGGGGLYSKKIKAGAFYNGAGPSEDTKFSSLLFHELGHAWADLFDEYDMGINEPNVRELANCVSPKATSIPWQGWIEKSRSEPQLAVSAVPTAPCGYSNYLKPTEECIMSKLKATRLCPICRERVVQKFYSTAFSLLWPSCPLEDEIVYLTRTGNISLHANNRLLQKGNFDVQWAVVRNGQVDPLCGGSTGVACQGVQVIEGRSYPLGASTFRLTITDTTDWVLTRLPKMTQSRDFTVQIVTAIPSSASPKQCYCTDESGEGCRGGPTFFAAPPSSFTSAYQAECKAGKNCTIDFTSSQYEKPFDIDDALDGYDSYVLYVGGAACAFALGLWGCVWNRNRKRMDAKVRPIFKVPFQKKYLIVRNIMMVTAVLIMLASIAAMCVALYLYTELTGLGKWVLIPGIVTALFLYLVALVGFWAAWYRSKCLLYLNGVILILCLGVCITVAYGARWFEEGVDSPSHRSSEFLRDTWEDLVEDSPDKVCALQKHLECSGYTENCQRLSSIQCPDNCEETNAKYSDACRKPVEDFIEDYAGKVFAYAIVVGCCVFVGVVFNFLLLYAVYGMEREIKNMQLSKRRRSVPAGSRQPDSALPKQLASAPEAAMEEGDGFVALLEGLAPEERAGLADEFRKFDKTGAGVVTKHQLQKFAKLSLGYEMDDTEAGRLIENGSRDGEHLPFLALLSSFGEDYTGQGDGPADPLLVTHQKEEVSALVHHHPKASPPPGPLPRSLPDPIGPPQLPDPSPAKPAPQNPVDISKIPPEYLDDPSLPDSERYRRALLRDAFRSGRGGAPPPPRTTAPHQAQQVHQEPFSVSLTLHQAGEPLGFDYMCSDGMDGVRVTAVHPNSASKRAGLQPGDVLKQINGVDVKSEADLIRSVQMSRSRNTEALRIEGVREGTLDSTIHRPVPIRARPPPLLQTKQHVAPLDEPYVPMASFGRGEPSPPSPLSPYSARNIQTPPSPYHSQSHSYHSPHHSPQHSAYPAPPPPPPPQPPNYSWYSQPYLERTGNAVSSGWGRGVASGGGIAFVSGRQQPSFSTPGLPSFNMAYGHQTHPTWNGTQESAPYLLT